MQGAVGQGSKTGPVANANAPGLTRSPHHRWLYGQRQAIEGTIAQGVRSFGLRRVRYRGLGKPTLQSVATGAALNVGRLAAWFSLRPLAPTRTSRFPSGFDRTAKKRAGICQFGFTGEGSR